MPANLSSLDKRQSRSRVALHDALERLIDAGGFGSVTISALAREAGVGRPVFYRLYEDIDAILADRLSIDLEEQLRIAEERHRVTGPSLSVLHAATVFSLHAIAARPGLYAALLGGGGINAITIFRQQVAHLMALAPPPSGPLSDVPEELRTALIASATSGFLLAWLERDCQPPVETATTMIETMLGAAW